MDREKYESMKRISEWLQDPNAAAAGLMQMIEDMTPTGEELENAKERHRIMVEEYPPSKYPLPWSRFKKGE